MATIAKQTVVRTGLDATYAAAGAGGDVFANDGNNMFHVKNGGGGAAVVTITSQLSAVPAGAAKTDVVVSVPAAEERMIGPFPSASFNDGSGQVVVSYDQVTSVTIAVIEYNRNS